LKPCFDVFKVSSFCKTSSILYALTNLILKYIAVNNAGGSETNNKGIVKPIYGISTPPPIIITGILMGGATSPKTAPIAINEPTASRGIPIANNTGATNIPVVNTQVDDKPVSIPGNITKRTIIIIKSVGDL